MAIHVFLADDHAVVRDGLRMILEAEKGITVVGEAGDGREAVRQVKRLRPDVAIVDIAMPELNGIEATLQIREARPATQVVILSMYATAEHIYRALEAGALGYVLKESAGKEVLDAIRAVQVGRRFLSEKIAEAMIEDYIRQRRASPDKDPLSPLTPREREVFQLVVESKSSKEIAKIMYLSPKTIETYRSRLMQKLDVHDVPSLVKFAVEHGLTTTG